MKLELKSSKVFKYGLNLRPEFWGDIPNGYIKVEDSSEFKYGIAFYEEEIPFSRVSHFSLTQVDVDIPHFTSLVFEKYSPEAIGRYKEFNLISYVCDEIRRYLNDLRVSLKDTDKILANIKNICSLEV